MRVVLIGRVTVLDSVTYTHPNGTSASFNIREVELRRALTPREEFRKRFAAARSDFGDLMRAGLFALKKGLLADFYRAVDKVLEIEPQHKAAVRVAQLRKQLKTPLPDDPDVERKLRTIVERPAMRIERSNHFILLTDTALEPREGSRKRRAHERLDLLELFYEAFGTDRLSLQQEWRSYMRAVKTEREKLEMGHSE